MVEMYQDENLFVVEQLNEDAEIMEEQMMMKKNKEKSIYEKL